jgi:3-oxosteroid 1-dehydrogenase
VIDRSQGLPDVWDEEADLVVLGSGSAGLTGAIVAAVEGASVIVLEKAEVVGGTSAVSGGGFWVPLNRHMADRGIDDSREEALEYMRACAGEAGDDSLIVALVDHGAPMVEFLEERAGCSFRAWPKEAGCIDYRPWLPGAKRARTLDAGKFTVSDLGEWREKMRLGGQSAWLVDKHDYYGQRWHAQPTDPSRPARHLPPGVSARDYDYWSAGTALMSQLLRAALEQGVSVLTETPGAALLVEGGRVVGVTAEREGNPFFVRALRGVLVATGGYTNNPELLKLWMPRPLEFTCDVESNTGDGHLMGMAIGAQIADVADAWWMPNGAGREDRALPHTLMVNGLGRRFINEAMNYYDVAEGFSVREGGSPRNYPAWFIFDQQGVEKYAILDTKRGLETMKRADTLEELAEQVGLDPAAVTATVSQFNEYARTGVDLDFHRGEDEWDQGWGDPNNLPNNSLGTIERPPFYAHKVIPGALATRGGLRVNADGQVLSAAPPFDPIPGLYAAGNSSNGSVAGAYTGAGATIGAAMTFGYVIGRRVASGVDAPAPAAAA